MARRIFIVGMYKSGTSWLLSALSQVKGSIGLREIDILDAVCTRNENGIGLKPPAERLEYVFGGAAWCALPVDYFQENALKHVLKDVPREELPYPLRLGNLPPHLGVLAVRRLLAYKRAVRKGMDPVDWQHAPELPAIRMGQRIERGGLAAFHTLPVDVAEALFSTIGTAESVTAAAELFVSAHERACREAEVVVLKGADQVQYLDVLQEWQPDAKKVVIVRDGRDVALSAVHYRALMREWRMPWAIRRKQDGTVSVRGIANRLSDKVFSRHIELPRMLAAWSNRIERVLESEARGELCVVRYEDLSTNFELQFRRVLEYLDMSVPDEDIRRIAANVSFEAQTGRKQGEVKDKSIQRSGSLAGWVRELTFLEKFICWRMAGKQLRSLGYSRSGEIQPRRKRNAM